MMRSNKSYFLLSQAYSKTHRYKLKLFSYVLMARSFAVACCRYIRLRSPAQIPGIAFLTRHARLGSVIRSRPHALNL